MFAVNVHRVSNMLKKLRGNIPRIYFLVVGFILLAAFAAGWMPTMWNEWFIYVLTIVGLWKTAI